MQPDAATEEMRTENTEKKLFCSVFSVFFFLWQKLRLPTDKNS
jgi:hypothetical protein